MDGGSGVLQDAEQLPCVPPRLEEEAAGVVQHRGGADVDREVSVAGDLAERVVVLRRRRGDGERALPGSALDGDAGHVGGVEGLTALPDALFGDPVGTVGRRRDRHTDVGVDRGVDVGGIIVTVVGAGRRAAAGGDGREDEGERDQGRAHGALLS